MKFLQHTSPFIALTLSLCLGLNACSVPPTRQQSELQKGFRTQQAPDQPIPNPLKDLPQKPDLGDQIELLGIDRDLPVTASLKRTLPKNLPGSLKNVSITPVQTDETVIEPPTAADLALRKQNDLQAWEAWLVQLYGFTQEQLAFARKETLKQARKDFREQLRSLIKQNFSQGLKRDYVSSDSLWDHIAEACEDDDLAWLRVFQEFRQDRREILTLVRNFKRAQKERRQMFKDFEQKLEPTYRQDLQQIRAYFDEVYQTGGFSVQCGWCFVGFAVVFGLLLVLGAINAAVNGPAMLETQRKENEFKQRHPQPSPPNPVNNPPGAQNPNATTTYHSAVQNPDTSTLQPALETKTVIRPNTEEQLYTLEAMLARINDTVGQLQGAKSVNITIRMHDILEGLNLWIDPEDLNANPQWSEHCDSTVFDANQDLRGCDYANINQLSGITFNPRDVAVGIPQWMRLRNIYQRSYDSQLIITQKFQPVDQLSDEAWFRKYLTLYFPNTANHPDNIAKIDDFFQSFHSFYFEISSPKICGQGVDVSVYTPSIADTQWRVPAKSMLFDGDYTFRFGARMRQPGSSNDQDLVKLDMVSIPGDDLANRLGLAAYTQQQQNKRPLTLMDYRAEFVPDLLQVRVDNTTGNLWDLWVEKVGDPMCKIPVYTANCYDASQAVLNLDTRILESGVYRVRGKYSEAKYPDGQYPKDKPFAQPPVKGPVPADADQYGEGYPVFAQNLSVTNQVTEDEYKFLVANGKYSTFALLSKTPADTTLHSQFKLNQTPTQVETLEDAGDTKIYSDLLPPNTSVAPLTLPPSIAEDVALPGTKVVAQAIAAANTTNTGSPSAQKVVPLNSVQSSLSASESSNLTNMKANLYLELGQPQSQPEAQPFDAFKTLTVPTSLEQRYVNVGAIVDFSNQNFKNNQVLKNQAADSVPMLLQVKNTANDEVVAKWPFQARLGSQTVVQRYWDGQPQDNAGVKPPAYTQGDYEVDVIFDLSANSPYAIQRLLYGGAFIMQPALDGLKRSVVDISIPSGQNPSRGIQLKKIQPLSDDDFSFKVDGKIWGVQPGVAPTSITIQFNGMNITKQELVSFNPSTGDFVLYVKEYEFTYEPIQFKTATVTGARIEAYYESGFGIANIFSEDKLIIAEIPSCEIRAAYEGKDPSTVCSNPIDNLSRVDQGLKTIHDTLYEWGMRPAEGGGLLGVFAATAFTTTIEMVVPAGITDALLAMGGPFTKVGKRVVNGKTVEVIRVKSKDYFKFVDLIKSQGAGNLFEGLVKYVYRIQGTKIIKEGEEYFDNVGNLLGEIDFESTSALYEVGLTIGGKGKQLTRLAQIAQDRGKKLVVVYGPDTRPGTIREYQRQLDRSHPGVVSFELFHYTLQ